MRLLLDTHVLLWWLSGGEALTVEAREAITNPENQVSVSAATAWEISIKETLGKLRVPSDLEYQLDSNTFGQVTITVRDALAAARLPRYHEDPFDRMLIAQAQLRDLTIATRDRRFAAYDVQLLGA